MARKIRYVVARLPKALLAYDADIPQDPAELFSIVQWFASALLFGPFFISGINSIFSATVKLGIRQFAEEHSQF